MFIREEKAVKPKVKKNAHLQALWHILLAWMHLIFNTLFFAKGGSDEELQYANVGMRLQQGRDVQTKAKMEGYGQIGFPDKNDQPIAGRSGAQGAEQVEYGQIKFAERPEQKKKQIGHHGGPEGLEQVEYGQIKFK